MYIMPTHVQFVELLNFETCRLCFIQQLAQLCFQLQVISYEYAWGLFKTGEVLLLFICSKGCRFSNVLPPGGSATEHPSRQGAFVAIQSCLFPAINLFHRASCNSSSDLHVDACRKRRKINPQQVQVGFWVSVSIFGIQLVRFGQFYPL